MCRYQKQDFRGIPGIWNAWDIFVTKKSPPKNKTSHVIFEPLLHLRVNIYVLSASRNEMVSKTHRFMIK